MAEVSCTRNQTRNHIYHKRRILKILATLTVLMFAIYTRLPENIRGYGYGLFREVLKISSLFDTRGLSTMESAHFIVKYPKDIEQTDARLVLNTAEDFFTPVSKDLRFSMPKKIPIIIYSSKEKLNQFFGWPASESAMGVYWAGVIRVLAPKVWIEEGDPIRIKQVFISSGPMAHEYTHLVVDYKTRGNYPRWFTEGLAQYEEYKLTGFRFTDSSGSLQQNLYSFADLDKNFDYLPNQSLAYRQSFYAVKFIVDNYGSNSILKIIDVLAKGKSMDRALLEVVGVDMKSFEQKWREWILVNMNDLE